MLPLLEDFLLSLKTNQLSEETVYNYERDLQVLENFLKESKISFENLNKKHLLYYKAYLNSRDRKTAKNDVPRKALGGFSINRMLSAFRSYLKFLIEMDYNTPISPDMVKLVKTDKKHPKISEFDQIVKLVESPSTFEKNKRVATRNRTMFEMLFSTGMRISELLNLKLVQIDKTGKIFIKGKGKKERFVYLTERAEKHLQEYLKVRGIVDSTYLFIPFRGKNNQKKDKKVSPTYLQSKIKKYREMLGINVPISCHSLRHAFATYMAENGASAAALQILLGHESLDTTTRYINASDRYAERIHRKHHPLK